MTNPKSDLELFSDSDSESRSVDLNCNFKAKSNSPEIAMQNEADNLLTSHSLQGTSYNHGSFSKISRGHTTVELSSRMKKSTNASQRTPHSRRGKRLCPSKLIPFPDDADDSTSDHLDDETAPLIHVREKKRRRQQTGDLDNSYNIKAMLLSLCEKVDKNTQALQDIQKQQHIK